MQLDIVFSLRNGIIIFIEKKSGDLENINTAICPEVNKQTRILN